jgi:hypothetical protein
MSLRWIPRRVTFVTLDTSIRLFKFEIGDTHPTQIALPFITQRVTIHVHVRTEAEIFPVDVPILT